MRDEVQGVRTFPPMKFKIVRRRPPIDAELEKLPRYARLVEYATTTRFGVATTVDPHYHGSEAAPVLLRHAELFIEFLYGDMEAQLGVAQAILDRVRQDLNPNVANYAGEALRRVLLAQAHLHERKADILAGIAEAAKEIRNE